VASSQEQVADELSGLMLAGLDNDLAAHISVGKRRHRTFETIGLAA
jgi:hypothetical protein